MWIEENHRFVRTPVPKSFDRCVDRLQDRDSVLFASISLPSLIGAVSGQEISTGRSKSAPNEICDPVLDVAKASRPLNNSANSIDSEKAALLRRVEELEQINAHKDHEIARLQHQLQKMRPHQAPAVQKTEQDECNYKQQYEALKFQYDKLREALAENGKVRRVRVKSAQVVKLAM